MICPNCSEQLEVTHLSNQTVHHCSNCGGSFFLENGINRITPDDAKMLAADTKTEIAKGGPKICPHDSLFLQLMENDEAIPSGVCLYKCPKCDGVFANASDIVKFKKAQEVKVEYFKIWNNPLPSLRAVLVLSLVALISLSVIANLNNKAIQSTQAEDLVKNVLFIKSGNQLLVNFRTTTPYFSTIIIQDKNTNTVVSKDITTKPTVFHNATVENVDMSHDIWYQITLKDESGKQYKGEFKKVITE